jgi:nucleoside triphosphate pyrophosphatase
MSPRMSPPPHSHIDPPPPGVELRHVRLFLASRSPRRRQLLQEHGYDVRLLESGLDDGLLRCGLVEPAQWVAALAYLKAEAGLRAVQRHSPCLAPAASDDPAKRHAVILGADTAVVAADRIIGQPRDADDARRILETLSDGPHEVVTGVALLDLEGTRRTFFHDTASVEVGRLSEEAIQSYLETGLWQGKAGAYNLRERLEAGWPIRYEGDPTTIMGLPMDRLGEAVRRFCQL